MRKQDFTIGSQFLCGGRRWLFTDVGTRVIVAVRVDVVEEAHMRHGRQSVVTRNVTPEDLKGPPYYLAETVFDEDDMEGCVPWEKK